MRIVEWRERIGRGRGHEASEQKMNSSCSLLFGLDFDAKKNAIHEQKAVELVRHSHLGCNCRDDRPSDGGVG
jgi:hypothetical protein